MIRSRINLYRGINAHFQSYAQYERDGWTSFHAAHIVHLVEAIDRLLPPGYEVLAERSLQVRLHNPNTGEMVRRAPQPDITIWGTEHPVDQPESGASLVSTPTLTKPVLETMTEDPEELLNAVVIKELFPDGEALPVTRIELLSPTNKVGEERIRYLAKRDATLEMGTVLVELDYLHTSDSVVRGLPGYASRQAGAYPFTILVSDPRPTLESGKTDMYGFFVDDPMPIIEIPLAEGESIQLDFGAVYNHTFESNSAYSKRARYDREPMLFEAFHLADQQRVWRRMLLILDAEKAGQDLSQVPFTPSRSEPVLDQLPQDRSGEATLMIDEASLTAYWLVREAVTDQSHRLVFSERGGVEQEILVGSPDEVQQHYTRLKAVFENEGWAAAWRLLEGLRFP